MKELTMTLPNFLIIGAAKSGTTAIYRYIKQHPQIFMPARKEPHHFSFTEQSKLTAGPGDYVRTAITDLSEYEQLFSAANYEKAIGEASPTYIYIPGTAERILNTIPDVKLIAILRNPVDRAFSAYMHLVRDGLEESENFKDALTKESERIKNNWGPIWHYTKAGFYHEQLSRFFKIFPPEKIKILIYDDFKKKPHESIREVFQFLGVDTNFVPDISAKPNVSGYPKNHFYQNLISYFFDNDNPIRSISRKLISEEIRWRFTSKIRNTNLEKPIIPLELQNELIELFTPDVLKLEELINRDLSFWITTK